MATAPHVIPYQGSKRKLAEQILSFIACKIDGALYEPFAGSAAITLAAASQGVASKYVVGDKYQPLTELWKLIIDKPEYVYTSYASLWYEQLECPKEYFIAVRESYKSDSDPVKLLYLLARCVKNSIRFNARGEFNQSADNRRLGMKPEKLHRELLLASQLLRKKTTIVAGDFMDILNKANSNDVVYMDPPWQGTSTKRDPRYANLLDYDSLVSGLEELNKKDIPFILSFDGSCGDRNYGVDLPAHLKLTRVWLNAGRSSQATLLGRNDTTIESLYLSDSLVQKNKEYIDSTSEPEQIKIFAS